MNRSKAAKLLINEGSPAGVYDNLGNSALCLLIEKIPEVALKAMDQFHSVDTINRKEFYFLNYLEGTKLKEQKTPARTPLEIAVQNERFDIIMHPVMQRLIAVKWKMYGKWGAVQDLVLNLLYTILWTILAVSLPKQGRDLYLPIAENSWRLVIGILLVIYTIVEIRKQVIGNSFIYFCLQAATHCDYFFLFSFNMRMRVFENLQMFIYLAKYTKKPRQFNALFRRVHMKCGHFKY